MNLSNTIKESLNIEHKARQAAIANQPHTDDLSLDANEQEIISTVVEHVDSKKEEVRGRLSELADRRLDIQSKMEEASNLKLVIEDIRNNYNIYKSTHKGNIIDKFDNYSLTQRQLASFKDENRLEREAYYPESRVFKLSIIGVVFLIEVILNANMFAIGSALGLLGGILSATIISVINVGAGVLTGYFIIRKINHIDIKIKIKGWILFITYFLLIPLLFNLLVAHYRAALALDPAAAFSVAPLNLITAPFLIANFDAWVLFVVGMLVSIIACYEGYTLDDVYPEYGKRDREYKQKKNEYNEAKKDAYESLNAFSSQGIQKIHSQIITLSRGLIDYENRINESEHLINDFDEGYLSQAEEAIRILLNSYRNTNKRVRNTPSPAYFEEDYNHDFTNKMISDPSVPNSKNVLARLTEIKLRLEENKNDYLNQISELRSELKNETDTWFNEIESSIIQNR